MKTTYFIQFYTERDVSVDGHTYYPGVHLYNGFSNTLHLCKNLGDVVWVDTQKMNLPTDATTLYVSVFFGPTLLSVLAWAEEHPNVKVVIGGPAITHRALVVQKPLPNVKLVPETVERVIFNQPDMNTWALDFPIGVSQEKVYVPSYSVGRTCYWGHCTFCSYPRSADLFARGVDYLPKTWDRRVWLWLATPSLTASFLEENLSKLNSDVELYLGVLRADKDVIQALKKALPTATRNKEGKIPLRVCFGVECPSNRMLKLMNKGVTTVQFIELIKVLKQYDCMFLFSLIDGWKDLKKEDLGDIENFCKEVATIAGKLRVRLHQMSSELGEEVHQLRYRVGNDKVSYEFAYEPLSGEAAEANALAADIYYKYFDVYYVPLGGSG